MRQPVRLAIIGLGFGAKVHLPAFLSIPGVRVVGVADSGLGAAKRVAATVEDGVMAWHDWKEAIEASEVDAISVVTPPPGQAEIVCAALATGKHVLCEKPFGMNGEQAAEMWENAQATDRVNAVDFQFRMEPGLTKMKQLIDSGQVGEVRRIKVKWLTRGGADPAVLWSWRHDTHLGGGVLNGFVSHVIDYLEWMCGIRISCVSGRCEILVGERRDAGGRKHKVTAEDSCELVCYLANGAVANVTVSNCCPSANERHQIDVEGLGGRLSFIHKAPFARDSAKLFFGRDSPSLRPVSLEALPGPECPDTRLQPFRQIAARFVEAASGSQVRDLPDFACGLRVQRILDAARESLRSGCVVWVVEEGSACR